MHMVINPKLQHQGPPCQQRHLVTLPPVGESVDEIQSPLSGGSKKVLSSLR